MPYQIQSLNLAGEGLTPQGNPIPFTLPGEQVETAPLRILVPSPDRVVPPCPHFGLCGGCQLQHAAYPAQLANKAAQVLTLLTPTGIPLPDLQVHPSPPLAYRNRIRLTLAEVDGTLRAGYILHPAAESSSLPRPGPGRALPMSLPFLPIQTCPIAAPILWQTAETLLEIANGAPGHWLRLTDQLELFTNADESALQFTVYLRPSRNQPATRLLAILCDHLRTRIPQLTGAGIALLPAATPQRSRRTEHARPGPTWGSPGLTYKVGDLTYWVPRTAFFQVNRFLTPELISIVTANRTGALAWDLYAGVGLFSRALARSFAEVVAVEAAEPAATALAATKLPNLHAVKASTLDFLQSAVLQRERPGLIVLDPPRSGAGPEVCALLARVAAPTLVYVSCGPQSLPADLVTLTSAGYTLTALHLVDLFPQTHHLETIAILNRA